MNKIISFVRLDLRLIKPYLKGVLFMFALGIFMGFMFKSATTISAYLMMMLLLIMSYPFAITDKNNLNILYGTLSVSRKSVVIGRYIFVLLCTLASIAASVIGSLLLTVILKLEFNAGEIMLMPVAGFALISLVVSLQYPVYFKFGYTKAKIAAMIPLTLVLAGTLLLTALPQLSGGGFSLNDFFAGLLSAPAAVGFSCISGGLLLLVLSCFISYKLYKNKDA